MAMDNPERMTKKNKYPYLLETMSVSDPFGEKYIVLDNHTKVRVQDATSKNLFELYKNMSIQTKPDHNWFREKIDFAKEREKNRDLAIDEKKRASGPYDTYELPVGTLSKTMSSAMGRPATTEVRYEDKKTSKNEFNEWWHNIGSGIVPRFTEDQEEFAERVAKEAFLYAKNTEDTRSKQSYYEREMMSGLKTRERKTIGNVKTVGIKSDDSKDDEYIPF